MTFEFGSGLEVQSRHQVCDVVQTFSLHIYVFFCGKHYSRQVKKYVAFKHHSVLSLSARHTAAVVPWKKSDQVHSVLCMRSTFKIK